MPNSRNHPFDVIIIGGSYAGLSSAMTLGRSLRNVLVIDSGSPCNRQTPHSHNFLTQDGKTPAEISTVARRQVEVYQTIQFHHDFATSGIKVKDGFEIGTQSGKNFIGKKLIFATGIKDIFPDIKGLSECWGISVVHCPYCHGYENRNRKTGIIASGNKALHLAALVNNLTNDITILHSGKAEFTEAQKSSLNKHKIEIIEKEVSAIEHENGMLHHVVFADGDKMRFDVIYAATTFTQHSEIPAQLGCELTEHGYIKVDNMQKTSLAGVYACGDNMSMMRSVANAVSTGNFAGAVVNSELTEEQF